MSIKSQILELLSNSNNKYLSGQKIANKLFVTRSAIWKGIKALQSDGYEISAIPNMGYCLLSESDILTEEGIRKHLSRQASVLDISLLSTVSSTNTYLKELASKNFAEGKVVISQEQTNGKGRLGRNFYSPANCGIYMSILLRPKIDINDAILFTILSAVAVCEAIEMVSGEKAKIKWVNDIFIGEKKVCGILTEASVSMEDSNLDYVIIGIGINVYTKNFPPELKDIATSIFDKQHSDIRNSLIAQILNKIVAYYINFEKKEFINKYKQRSLIIGREITVFDGTQKYNATALHIDDQCQLVIKTTDGIKILSSGEIGVKL